MYKAALFDLDGVVFNTEGQYTIFWGSMARKYFPDMPDFEKRIKGMTLVQIFEMSCPDDKQMQKELTKALDDFEAQMSYDYVPGFEAFIADLRKNGVKTAVVTSSNHDKMDKVYKAHPDFPKMFDAILTSEDFEKSKPDPDCYIKGAQRFGLTTGECAGFEDSINGLKAVKAANMYCVGLATTNPAEVVAQYADIVLENYVGCNNVLSLFV